MSKRNSYHEVCCFFICIALAMLVAGCSDRDEYQSYTDGNLSQKVEDQIAWSSELPFKGSTNLAIEAVNDTELLISDPGNGYQLVKIDRTSGLVRNGYLKLGSGSEHCWCGSSLLVSSEKKGQTIFHMVDYKSLERRYTTTISHKKQGDFSIPGQDLTDNTLVLFYSDFKIKRYSYTDYAAQMQYTIPYLESAKFSFYLLSVGSGQVRKYEGIQVSSLGDLRDICSKSLTAAKTRSMTPLFDQTFKDLPDAKELMKQLSEKQQSEALALLQSLKKTSGEYEMQDYLYYVEKIFLVGNARTLVFVLANHLEDRHFYTMDLQEGTPSIEEHTAVELALLYDELTVKFEERQHGEEEKSRGYIKISGQEYKADDVALFRDTIVFAARTRTEAEREPTGIWAGMRKRVIPSTIICVGFGMERKWQHPFNMPHCVGELIKDYSGDIVYVPSSSSENKYMLVGLNVRDGSQANSLPANFRTKMISQKSYLFPTGTYYDFDNGKLYIHDIKKNTIVCSTFER
jgi:hypothetical protein